MTTPPWLMEKVLVYYYYFCGVSLGGGQQPIIIIKSWCHFKVAFFLLSVYLTSLAFKRVLGLSSNKQTNNNDLLEKDGGTKNCMYKD